MEEPTEQHLSFEEALSRLEAVVQSLEDGGTDLATSLALFEDGVKLSRRCLQVLDDAQSRITMLVQGPDGEALLRPADDEFGQG